ncbi:hypothetical protein [Microterricola gilva]|uniref:hypothetical protein n=1 Tax=Microterricola gilva TaxID=393267 RepID=UPI0013EE4168|nr:hypothetical protein [Microterricola gilva]
MLDLSRSPVYHGGHTQLPIVAEMPHDGFTNSGYGKDLAMYGVEDYTRITHVIGYAG